MTDSLSTPPSVQLPEPSLQERVDAIPSTPISRALLHEIETLIAVIGRRLIERGDSQLNEDEQGWMRRLRNYRAQCREQFGI